MTMEPDDAVAWVDLAVAALERAPGVDQYHTRAESFQEGRLVYRQGQSRNAGSTKVAGVGIRVLHATGIGYAYTNEPSRSTIQDAIAQATRLAESQHRSGYRAFSDSVATGATATYAPQEDGSIDDHDAVEDLLRRTEEAALAADPDVQAIAALAHRRTRSVAADSMGGHTDIGFLNSTLLCQTTLRRDGRTADGTAWAAGERGHRAYDTDGSPESIGADAVAQTLDRLVAKPIPTQRARVLCDSHLTGLMVHESFGHLTEYDLVSSGWSVLQGRLGTQVAAPGITIKDVPVRPDGQGVRVPYDSEGTAGRDVTILQDGVLKGYMHGAGTAAEEGTAPTGNARALHIAHQPIVRMRNTYMEGGDLSHDEALEALGDGIYLCGGRGGSPRSDGSFMFTAQRGYRVERGELQEPIHVSTIQGNVLDLLNHIEGRTRDVHLSTTAFGGCGKWDQSFIHVGHGGPETLVSEALVGGQG